MSDPIRDISLPENVSAINPPLTSVKHPFVCINERVAVVLFERSGKIYYIVATLRQGESLQNDEFEWGACSEYGDGCKVKAALNNRNEIIIVRSRVHSRECMYRAGMVKMDGKPIEWWNNARETKLADGVNPSVAMNDRSILFVHEQARVFYRSYYTVGEIRDNNVWTVHDATRHLIPALRGYQQVSVAMNNNNRVVFSCRWKIGSNLYYATGELKERTLENVTLCDHYTEGIYSHISLFDNTILEVHENYYLNSWVYKCGQLLETIKWGNESENSRNGFHLSVAMFNDRWIIIFVEGLFRRELKYMMGHLTQI